ncbi:MAG: GNAT family N-acetyltransferase [Microcoleaceae cyanobacterium]
MELIISELLESDFIYFEQGAQIEYLEGAVFVQMTGLEKVAAACVVQRINPSVIFSDLNEWLFIVEAKFRKSGNFLVRLYLQSQFEQLEIVLRKQGYQARTEIGLIGNYTAAKPPNHLLLHPVKNEDDWLQKLLFHRDCKLGPDGYETEPEKWVEMERRKYEQGTLQPYLVEVNGQICGAVGTIETPNLLRLKNLVIHPQYRKRGFASQTVYLVSNLSKNMGKSGVGCFAVAGGIGEKVYQGCGLVPQTKQVEWTKNLT